MPKYAIDFNKFDWEETAPGMRQKIFVVGKNRIRLLKLDADFTEQRWCTKGHTGYVMSGDVIIEFEDSKIEIKSGNGLYISGGDDSRHKAKAANGKPATLILFEEA